MLDDDAESMLDSLPGAVLAVDLAGEVVAANDGCAVAMGWPLDDLEGATIGELSGLDIFDDGVEERYETALSELRSGDVDDTSFPVEVRLGGDGPPRKFEARVSLHRDDDDGVTGTVWALSSVGTRDRYDETTEALHDATRRLMAAETKSEAYDICGRAAHEILGFEGTGVREHDPDAGLLRHVSFGGRVHHIDERPPFPVDDSPHGRAFRNDETVVDVIPDEGDPLDRDAFSEAMYVPIGDYGVLSLGTMTGSFADADVWFAEILAENTEAALTAIEQREQLREQRQELERQNERLEEFASIVAHDLENPISLAAGSIDAYRDTGDESLLENARDALDRMQTIVSDVLALARQGQTVEDPGEVDLEAAATQAWATLGTDEADLAVETSAVVVADRNRLLRLLENLFSNAVEHGDADVVRVVDHPDGFAVADDGEGFPDVDLAELFDRSFTTAEDGTGFGLAIVEDIAEAHGWSVEPCEEGADGACFRVTGATVFDD